MSIRIRPSARKTGSKSPTTASRKALTAKKQAMPGGRYPIPNIDFLKRAIRSIGRTPPDKRPAVVSWIKRRAAALGRTDLVQNLSNELKAIELAGAIPVTSNTAVSGAQSKLGLKSKKGTATYAGLRKKGIKHGNALKAAKKAEQDLDFANPVANAPAVPNKFGLKNPKSTKVYAKARKRGLPHNIALKAARLHDKKNADELSNSPKV